MPEFSPVDCAHMARALELAERGQFSAQPNPMVGCVIVNDDVVVGEGWHELAGAEHAEINALRAAGDRAAGASVYVTLEPCAHHGKTPPCAEALIEAGVGRVVAAMRDPHEKVAGKGLRMLSDAGIEVELGLMRAAAEALNAGFVSRVTRRRPFVRVKVAASIDGATAMTNGESQWISGPASRADVQRLRARSGAVMTGVGTVLADDPSLNVRSEDIDTRGLQPLRVVLDSHLRMPASARMLALPGRTLVCCTDRQDDAELLGAGAEVSAYGAHDGRVDAAAVLEDLASREVNDVLVEAGPGLSGYLLENDLVNELVIYQAPHIMGSDTRRMFDTPAWTVLADRRDLDIRDVTRVGADTRITATIKD